MRRHVHSCLEMCAGLRLSRRQWMHLFSAGAAGALLATKEAHAGALERVFPPPPPTVSPIKGVVDFHVHSAPDVFGRSLDDDDVGELAVRKEMGALVLKNHVFETASRAYILRKRFPGLQVFGGIVLNGSVGGLNPQAVQWMSRMQGQYGKVVWLPTIDADHHVKFFKDAPEGIKVVEGGKPVPALMEIMKICADNDLILHTGHSSAEEVLILANAAQQVGLRKLVVTHALFSVVDMSIDQLKQGAQLGAKFELAFLGTLMGPTAHLPFMTHWKRVSAEDNAAAIKAVGAQHFVLGTDLGQTGNPSHPDGYQMFVQQLEKAGIAKQDIDLIGRVTPGQLLGIAS
ncbi:MAG TPA: DUF6282 family protein [Alphaproteobacteria bacterium]|nr:DUF6282 family protein [Alphaproteobacteria bacterium]